MFPPFIFTYPLSLGDGIPAVCGFPHSLCDNITDKGLSTSAEELSVHGSERQSAESMDQPEKPQVVSTYPSRGPSSAGIHNRASGWLIVLGIVQILVGVFYTILGFFLLYHMFVFSLIIAEGSIVIAGIVSGIAGSVAIGGVCTKKQKLFKATQVLSIVSSVLAIGVYFLTVFLAAVATQSLGGQQLLFPIIPALTMLIAAIISAILASKRLASRNQNKLDEGVIHVPSPWDFNQEQGVQLDQRPPATEGKPDIPANEVEKEVQLV